MRIIDSYVKVAQNNGKKIYIRGTTFKGILLGMYFNTKNVDFMGFIDNDSEKWGKKFMKNMFVMRRLV